MLSRNRRHLTLLLATLGLALAAAPSPANAAQQRTTAAVSIRFADTWSDGDVVTRDQARQALFTDSSAPAKLYPRTTGGQLGFVGKRSAAGDVFGTWTLPISRPPSSCNPIARGFTANAIVVFTYFAGLVNGVDLGQYQHVQIYAPRPLFCDYSGIAGGGETWSIVTKDDSIAEMASVASHEIGHNLRLDHAMAINCAGDQFAAASKCGVDPYGDFYDLMGSDRAPTSAGTPLQAYSMARFGAVTPSQIRQVPAGTGGSFHLVRPESSAAGTKLLMIPRTGAARGLPNVSCDFWQTLGCNAQPGNAFLSVEAHDTLYGRGVLFHLTPGLADGGGTALLRTSRGNRLAGTGDSITDPATGVTVRVTAITADGADVTLTVPDAVAPDAPLATAASWVLSWPAAKDDVAVDAYEIELDRGDGSGTLRTVLPATACTPDCRYDRFGDAALAPGARARVVAIDTSNNRSAPSPWVSLAESGATPVTAGLRAVAGLPAEGDIVPTVTVTGTVAVRNGLRASLIVDGTDFAGSTTVWQISSGPFSGPQPFTLARRVFQDFRPDASGGVPATVSIRPTALYGSQPLRVPGVVAAVPVSRTDTTPPAKPTITIDGKTVRVQPGAGEPADSYAAFVVPDGFGGMPIRFATTRDAAPTFALIDPAPGFPFPASTLFVAALDAAGNWVTSAPVRYTP